VHPFEFACTILGSVVYQEMAAIKILMMTEYEPFVGGFTKVLLHQSSLSDQADGFSQGEVDRM
jgi:hypothetical protein